MRIVGHNVFGIGSNGTIIKLIIISTGLCKSEVEIDIQKLCGVQSGNGFNHVVSNHGISLSGKDFLVLAQNLGVDA